MSDKKPVQELNFPAILYHREHTWLRTEGDTAVVGISDYAQDELGDIIFFELPSVGQRFAAGQSFGSVESVKVVSTLYMPVGGEVVAVNDALADTPELTNRDPYGDGWIIAVKPDNYDRGCLLTSEDYVKYLKTLK